MVVSDTQATGDEAPVSSQELPLTPAMVVQRIKRRFADLRCNAIQHDWQQQT